MLVDRFGRGHTYLRISITDRCNLRCRYCRPRRFVLKERTEILTFEEIARVARLLVARGVRKIRLTGGEPLVRRDVEHLVTRLAALPGLKTLGLTTNGVLLSERAAVMRAAGVTPSALNVSLDTLRRERFQHITGEDRLADVLAGIEAARAAGFTPVKINVVVMGGVNDDELCDFVEFARERPVRVRFIEYMPFRDNGWRRASYVSQGEMLEMLRARYALAPAAAKGVAKEFRVEGIRGGIGFITPLSGAFCGGCTRLRLTADGALKSCLFQPAEVSVRDLLRGGASDAEIVAAVEEALAAKPRCHPPVEELAGAETRAMVEIGG